MTQMINKLTGEQVKNRNEVIDVFSCCGRRGEWRDRGNNTTCPTPAGDAGQKHKPID